MWDPKLKPEVGWMVAFLTLLAILVFVIVSFVLAFPKCPSMLFYVMSTNSGSNVFLSSAPSTSVNTPGFGTSVVLAPLQSQSTASNQLAQTWFFRLSKSASGAYYMFNMLMGLALAQGSTNSVVLVNAKSSLKSAISVIPNGTTPSEFTISTQFIGPNGAVTMYLDPVEGTWTTTANSSVFWQLIPNQVAGNLSY